MAKKVGSFSITEEQLLAAMENSYGNFSTVAERLGCTNLTVSKRINGTKSSPASKKVQKKYKSEIEKIGDFVESKILKIMNETVFKNFSIIDDTGNVAKKTFKYASPQAARMIEFYARTKLRHRGYVERKEIEGSGTLKILSLKEYKKSKSNYDKGK